MKQVQVLLAAPEPPFWAVWAVAAVLFISGSGTFFFWSSLYFGRELCVDCVPFGLSTFRFLYWPMSDAFLCFLCFATGFMLVRKARFAYLGGVTLGLLFVFMAFLAWYNDLMVRETQLQPQFLNIWFVGWGSFLIWFMHHWRKYWSSSSSENELPVTKKRATI